MRVFTVITWNKSFEMASDADTYLKFRYVEKQHRFTRVILSFLPSFKYSVDNISFFCVRCYFKKYCYVNGCKNRRFDLNHKKVSIECFNLQIVNALSSIFSMQSQPRNHKFQE